ncbi:MAG: hypothetical protein ACJAY5_001640 [Actinomycetes bacterium]|jgi:hypothetical protein
MTPTLAPPVSLTAADRCDRCGATAYVRVVLQGGGELLFCSHHARKHLDAVRPIAARIDDESDRLDAVNAPPSDDSE